jgi:cobaltochelatase CobS
MLKCKVCGFTHKTEIVSHIEKEHADLATSGKETLDWYMAEYGVDVDDVVAPDKASKKESKPIKGGSVSETVKIRSVDMAKRSGYGSYVPKVNPGYVLAEHIDDICHDINEDRKVLLIGHTGTGKTSSIEQIAARMGQGVVRVNMNGQTTVGDFVGMWTVKGGETVWVDGTLPKAMREGHWLIVDELDFAEPAILSVLNAVLEKAGKLMLKEKGHELVEPHENFRLFGTANGVGVMAQYRGLYQGTNLMNEAFLDRWRVYHIDYLPAEEEVKALIGSVERMKGKEKIAAVIVRVANMIREAFKNEEISCTFSTRRMLDWAEMMIRYKEHPEAPFKAAQSTIFSKVSKEDGEVIKNIIQRVMVGGNK